jgi:histidinol-phosphate aminotransferase
VIVDEAYVEYAKDSLISLVKKYDNLIVLRTFSKAFGLASARMGYAITNPDLANSITRFAQIPFPLTGFGSKLAIKILEKVNVINNSIDELKHERDRLFNQLKKINGLIPFPSDANFILFSISSPYKKTYERLLKRGILVRKIGKVLNFNNCLRTTVGLPEMNDKLINALAS